LNARRRPDVLKAFHFRARFPNRLMTGRLAVAAMGGFALTAAFPGWNLPGAAWVGPALILFAAFHVQGGVAFRIGCFAGLVHALTSLSWLLSIPYTFHGIPLGPGAGWLALAAYVALYHGLWVWGCWKILPKALPRGENEVDEAEKPGWKPGGWAHFLRLSWRQRMLWALGCAVLWTGLEVVRAHFLSGFPWNLLGSSQFRLLPLIQVATVGGVYAVSFLVVWMSVSIGVALTGILREFRRSPGAPIHGVRGGSLMADVFVPLLAVAAVVSLGTDRVFSKPLSRGELAVAGIQPSIPQTVIWDSTEDTRRFEKVLSLTRDALKQKPDLVVWPESAFPGFTTENYQALTNLVTGNRVWTLLCADDADPPLKPGGERLYYNASFLFSPEDGMVGSYRKRRLVIFGEYVPLTRWLPFLKWLTPIDGGFTPGRYAAQFEMEHPAAQFSVLICFEDVFPQEVRDHVREGTDFLINLTNDGWFGEGACQWQQAAASVFRAVENGVGIFRCTNNGITCWIDPVGRICEVANPGNVYSSGYLFSRIPLPASGARTPTFYNLHGDVFGWGCVMLGAGWLGLAVWRARRRQNGAGDKEVSTGVSA
jgi:apolipoprotein N-acyltransferase